VTFDDDFIVLTGTGREERVRCKALDIEWPPPERLDLFGVSWQRESFSRITDAQRAELDFVCRGAQYCPVQFP
jgi:hypothetical protein